jgi:hypothetical protein
MRKLIPIAFAAAAVTAMLPSAPASATGVMKCNAGPQSGWKTQDALKAKLVKEGWTVRKSKRGSGPRGPNAARALCKERLT